MLTNAIEWAKKEQAAALKEAVELELPSGATILARRPNPLQLASWGRVPLSLASAAMKQPGAQSDPLNGDAAEEAIEMARFMSQLLTWCCVQPRVLEDPKGPDEIHPSKIPQEDWAFVLSWAMRGEEAARLEKFRSGGKNVGDFGGSPAVQHPAVEPAGDQR